MTAANVGAEEVEEAALAPNPPPIPLPPPPKPLPPPPPDVAPAPNEKAPAAPTAGAAGAAEDTPSEAEVW